LTPPVGAFDVEAFHRLIPSRYSEGGSVLADIADGEKMLKDLVLLDGATNDRIQGEQQGLLGISTYELVYGIPNAHIVNAAFTHTNQAGSRFNDETRGAWYAADERETSLAEVTYHKARRLAEIVVPGLPGQRPDEEVSTYDDWLADFRATFHILQPAKRFLDCLKPQPVPYCYGVSQQMARRLLAMKSNGLVYPSVRRAGFRCLVCFRPALVYNPRRAERLEIRFKATDAGYDHSVLKTSAEQLPF
jgi:hypothetical protein